MNENKTRGILSILIVGTVMIVMGIIAVYAYANDLKVDSEVTVSHLENFFSLFSGVIGVIIGYYFGKSGDSSPEE